MTDEVWGLTRRQVVGGAAALAALAAGGAAQAAATVPARLFEVTAQGVVFEDADGTGKRGAASKGVAGVMVSNGRDVALTDADGRWRLPVVPASRCSWSSRAAGRCRSIRRPACRASPSSMRRPARRTTCCCASRAWRHPACCRFPRFPVAPANGKQAVRRGAVHRPAAGKPRRGGLHPRRRGGAGCRDGSRVRHHHRRPDVRRPFIL